MHGLCVGNGVGECMQRSDTGHRFFNRGWREELRVKSILDSPPAFCEWNPQTDLIQS